MDAIEYSSHPSSQQILRDIVMKFKDRPGVHCIVAWHRVGHLEIGGEMRWLSPSPQSIVRRHSARSRPLSRREGEAP